MNEIVTVNTIIEFLKNAVETKQAISPSTWVDASQKLNVLLSDEHDILFGLQQQVANLKLAYLEEDEKRNVSAAKAKVEATDEYRRMRSQEAKIKRIEEFIRIAKLQARMKDTEFRGY